MISRLFYYLSVFFVITLSTTLYSQTTAIPDANFEQVLVNQGIDTNGLNGTILNADAQAINTLDLGNNDIVDLTGINSFTNLTDLDLGNNPIINVNLSGLTLLVNFRIDDTEALVTLNLTQNTLLETIYLETNASSSLSAPITSLDLSQNTNLISLEMRWFKNLTDLVLPATNTLTKVNIRYLADPTLDFSLLDGLENLQIRGSQVNTEITLPNVHTNLSYLNITSVKLQTIDISDYINLEDLYFWGTNVENLLFPNSTTLSDITIHLHNIQNTLDFSVLPNIKNINITSNKTTPLVVDLTQNALLERLNLSNNDMNSVDITQNTLLEKVLLNFNNLTAIDISQNTLLDRFEASSNKIPSIDLTQNTVLEYLYLRDNLIPTLNVTQNILLRTLDIGTNLFVGSGLDLTQNINLTQLFLNNNQVESLDISQNTNLTTLNIAYNIFPGNNILVQFYANLLNNNALRGRLIANNNLLTGNVPDFYGLYDPAVRSTRFQLYINENRFEFGHFETQHLGLVDLTNTMSIGPSPDFVIQNYFYAPQAKVDTIDTINANAGDSVTLTTVCEGSKNHYKWFKDGVLIPDAPDSASYTITVVNGCDTAVYYSEITSDLFPFENTDAPGTNGKNLVLVRNDITLNVTLPVEDCVALTSPLNGAINVSLNETLTWSESIGACGYFLSIGTTPGATDVLNNEDVGNVTNYNIGNNFPPNTQLYVTLTPYFYTGNAISCPEESFTTGTTETPTSCTNLIMPLNGDTGVPVTTNINWNTSAFAIGYNLYIGTTPGGDDLVNADIQNAVTSYNPTTNLPENTLVYVTIAPYNNLGAATGCIEESFTTVGNAPSCTSLTSPLNNDTDVLVTSNLSWSIVTDAIGYNLSVGTTSGGTDILNNQDVGNVNTFNLTSNLPYGTVIYVTILPYNTLNSALGCAEESFVTEQNPPVCTNLISPINGTTNIPISTDLSWTAISNATGYFISVGSSLGAIDIINTQDVGNVTTFDLPTDLPDETEIFVSIIPYNSAGNATGCLEESFVTEQIPPVCSNLISPVNGGVNVSIATDLSWVATANTTGYFISLGSSSGGTDIINNQDVGNVTTYNLPTDLIGLTEYFVTITPYNSIGNAVGCSEYSFTTGLPLPSCTNLISPVFQETNVALSTNLTWSVSDYAAGYIISIGTSTGASDIIAAEDVGNVTTYNTAINLPNFTTLFVTISAYNNSGTTVCGDDQFTTEDLRPLCVSLTAPLNLETNVPLSSTISWQSVINADGYSITMGTTSGGTDLVNAIDVGNITTYTYSGNLPQNTQLFVSVTPYNSYGEAINCVEEHFTTELLLPECTSLNTPINLETNVPITTNLSWEASAYTEGYILSVGTSSGGTELVNEQDVGNVTSYALLENLPSNTKIYVTVIAYNSEGLAINCLESSFTTEIIIPECTYLISPYNTETDVLINTSINWQAIENATGYLLSIGTTPNGNEILEAFNVGNASTYQPIIKLLDNTTFYVTITPYNSVGNAIGCVSEQFKTENFTIITPSFFTPNGDAFNQYWKVEDPKNEINIIHIFNRYGKLISSIKPDAVGWNGTFKGKNLPNDDYWYVIKLINGTIKKGHFTLKR